jgi:universal stress protein A
MSNNTYCRILLAVDLTADSLQIAERAKAVAAAHGAPIDVLHVVEPIPVVAPLDAPEILTPTMLETQHEIAAGARQRLAKLAADIGIAPDSTQVVIGNTQVEILRAARERGVDLIVLGGRERHGLSLLVDFTEDAVLHKAPCDVLTVRVKPVG